MQEFLSQTFWNNTILSYLIFSLCIGTSILIIILFKYIILKRLSAWAAKTETKLDDLLIRGIKKYLLPLLFIGAFYLSTQILYMHPTLKRIIDIATLALIAFFGSVFISTAIIFLFNKYWEKKNTGSNKLAAKWIAVVIKALVWISALLLFLDNIGFEITALVAGLGIGGIAIAFAAQAILEDIFSFITIFFDRPFEIDDFIIVGDLKGTVEHIGIKTTRLRSLNGEQLIFSNKDLTNSRVRNYKRMQNRRVLFTLGVTYDTPLHKLKEIPGLIKDMIDKLEDTTFDRAHFFEYADFSLNFEIAYYVLSQDYKVYMDVRQEINYLIKEEFDSRGIEFAFPTQTIHLQNSANSSAQKQDTHS